MRTLKHNPLSSLLGLTPGAEGDPWSEVMLVLALHVDHPFADGRQPGLYRNSQWSFDLVYSGDSPDLTKYPGIEKVKQIRLATSAHELCADIKAVMEVLNRE